MFSDYFTETIQIKRMVNIPGTDVFENQLIGVSYIGKLEKEDIYDSITKERVSVKDYTFAVDATNIILDIREGDTVIHDSGQVFSVNEPPYIGKGITMSIGEIYLKKMDNGN